MLKKNMRNKLVKLSPAYNTGQNLHSDKCWVCTSLNFRRNRNNVVEEAPCASRT